MRDSSSLQLQALWLFHSCWREAWRWSFSGERRSSPFWVSIWMPRYTRHVVGPSVLWDAIGVTLLEKSIQKVLAEQGVWWCQIMEYVLDTQSLEVGVENLGRGVQPKWQHQVYIQGSSPLHPLKDPVLWVYWHQPTYMLTLRPLLVVEYFCLAGPHRWLPHPLWYAYIMEQRSGSMAPFTLEPEGNDRSVISLNFPIVPFGMTPNLLMWMGVEIADSENGPSMRPSSPSLRRLFMMTSGC